MQMAIVAVLEGLSLLKACLPNHLLPFSNGHISSDQLPLTGLAPPPFGLIEDSTGIRKFWNTVWPVLPRKLSLGYSNALVEVLGIERGTPLSSYTTLCFTMVSLTFLHALTTYVSSTGRAIF